MKKYKKIVIGIDQSYTRTGISINADKKLILVTSERFKACIGNRQKRYVLKVRLRKIFDKCKIESENVIVILERIRTFSQGKQDEKSKKDFGLRPEYIKSTSKLIGMIIDLAYENGIDVYSVDTRSWMSKVLGTSKVNLKKYENYEKPEKGMSIEFITSKGFDLRERTIKTGEVKTVLRGKNAGKIKYDDDAADSACISMYGFIPEKKQNLLLEE